MTFWNRGCKRKDRSYVCAWANSAPAVGQLENLQALIKNGSISFEMCCKMTSFKLAWGGKLSAEQTLICIVVVVSLERWINEWNTAREGVKVGSARQTETKVSKREKEETKDKLQGLRSSADWQAKHRTSTSWGKAWLAFTNWNVIGDWGGVEGMSI